MIPRLDVSALFGGPAPDRDLVDAAILMAARQSGFMTIGGLPPETPIGPARRRALLRIFALPEQATRQLWRQKFAPSHANIYRGWFPLQNGAETYKEGIDLGPDIAYGPNQASARGPDDLPGDPPGDPLREPTPVPAEAALPGWRAEAAAYYRAMETIAQVLMHALARGLGLNQDIFDEIFAGGISTLRLIRYPLRPLESMAESMAESAAGVAKEALWVDHAGARHYMLGRAHVDSGLVTLLAQDGVSGLQARAAGGDWIDVPPEEGALAVNFGKLLERWTGGRIKATEHRVIGLSQERHSIPFFYEPRVDARIAPLPLAGIEPFAPFTYGDYLWSTMTKFVEFQGLEGLRRPQGR